MPVSQRIETALRRALDAAGAGAAPRKLVSAVDHAVLPGGARIRPTILMAVARACGEDRPALSDRAAAALELIHCASLVHDDLPCFDNADLRRGKPSVHRAFSEPLAVLAGDSLIVMAFDVLGRADRKDAARVLDLIRCLSTRTGLPNGICAGQGWESEFEIDLRAYHRAKTGSLFMAACEMGALSAGQAPENWTDMGALIGEAFQVADDLRDALLDKETLGKPVQQDDLHGRPNVVAELGVDGAVARLRDILAGAIASIPSCEGEAALAGMVRAQAEQIVPKLPQRTRFAG